MCNINLQLGIAILFRVVPEIRPRLSPSAPVPPLTTVTTHRFKDSSTCHIHIRHIPKVLRQRDQVLKICPLGNIALDKTRHFLPRRLHELLAIVCELQVSYDDAGALLDGESGKGEVDAASCSCEYDDFAFKWEVSERHVGS